MATIMPTMCLSGLPFSTLPEGVGPSIARATHEVLRPGGAFLVYQFSARARDYMARHFRRIDHGFEALNIPPCRLFWGWKDSEPENRLTCAKLNPSPALSICGRIVIREKPVPTPPFRAMLYSNTPLAEVPANWRCVAATMATK